jgi:hypothetical protein
MFNKIIIKTNFNILMRRPIAFNLTDLAIETNRQKILITVVMEKFQCLQIRQREQTEKIAMFKMLNHHRILKLKFSLQQRL